MAENGIPPPVEMKMSGDLTSNWENFEFEDYVLASGLKEKDAEVQAATLRRVMGSECRRIYKHNLGLTAAQEKDAGAILEALETYFKPARNVIFERFVFWNCKQDEVTHSLKYIHTASSGVPNFPEFVIVGMVDEVQMIHYDSNTMKAEPKQDWMSRVTADKADYWQQQTEGFVGTQQAFKANIEVAKQRFNQTGGVHIAQRMYGCEWDDETNDINGYFQDGYDGEDFIALDLKTLTWIAPKPEAVITKQKWDNDKAEIAQEHHYLTQICIEWLKKYVDYGKSSLLRTELPSVSLLQKTPSSPVSCHATGFYPDRVVMFWRKDGEELHEDVDHGEILPNHDGSFQMSVDLKLSSVPPEDWRRYDCVFQLSGVKDDIVTRLDKNVIKTNEGNSIVMTVIIVVAVLILLAVAVIGFFIYRKRNAKRPPSPINHPEVLEVLYPNA